MKLKKKMSKKGMINPVIAILLILIGLIAGYLILKILFNYTINIIFVIGLVLIAIISVYVLVHLGKSFQKSFDIQKCKTGKCEVKRWK